MIAVIVIKLIFFILKNSFLGHVKMESINIKYSSVFFTEIALPIKTISVEERLSVYIDGPDHMTKAATIPIHSIYVNVFFSELELMEGIKVYKIYKTK